MDALLSQQCHLVRVGCLQNRGDVLDADGALHQIGTDALERVDRIQVGDTEYLHRKLLDVLARLAGVQEGEHAQEDVVAHIADVDHAVRALTVPRREHTSEILGAREQDELVRV